MTRTCTVCTHPGRDEIDVALVTRAATYRDLAIRFGVSKDALSRHLKGHIPARLAQARDTADKASADDLLRELSLVKDDVERLKTKAEDAGDYRAAIAACDRAIKALELQARMLKIIREQPVVNLHLHPQWIALRDGILDALVPHPAARAAVLDAVRRLDTPEGQPVPRIEGDDP